MGRRRRTKGRGEEGGVGDAIAFRALHYSLCNAGAGRPARPPGAGCEARGTRGAEATGGDAPQVGFHRAATPLAPPSGRSRADCANPLTAYSLLLRRGARRNSARPIETTAQNDVSRIQLYGPEAARAIMASVSRPRRQRNGQGRENAARNHAARQHGGAHAADINSIVPRANHRYREGGEGGDMFAELEVPKRTRK